MIVKSSATDFRDSAFDRELPEGYREDAARHYAQSTAARRRLPEALLAFRVGSEWLGLNARSVIEVMPAASIHEVPHRHSTVLLGLANIRSRLQPCYSLPALFAIERSAKDNAASIYRRFLVVRHYDQALVLPVDEVRGTERYDPSQLEGVPATLSQALARFSLGILVAGDLKIGCLDHELLFYALLKEAG